MTLRFVKTAVLSSSDGIDFSNEVAVESEEATMARIAAERAQQRPLYEQLAEQKQKKQDEYDANTKLLFAPPKALDDEDISFLQTMQDSMQEAQRRRKEEEELQLDLFRVKRDHIPSQSTPAVKITPAEAKKSSTASVSIIRVAKRKAEPLEKEGGAKSKSDPDAPIPAPAPAPAPVPASAPAASLFGDYESDGDDSTAQ